LAGNPFSSSILDRVAPKEIDAFTILGYVPQPRQKVFHDLSKKRISAIFYGGAVGGGKSSSLTMDAIHNAVNYPGMRIGCIRRTYGELEESFLAELKKRKYAEPLGGRWNTADKRLRFSNGSEINFTYAESEQDASRLLGGEYQAFYIDEAGQMLPTVIQHIEERLRSGDRKLPVIGLRLGSNPLGSSHSYLKKRFILPTDYGKNLAEYEGRTVAFVQAKWTDNPFIDKGYESILDAIPDPNRRAAMRDGDWDAQGGMFFEQWRRDRHVVDPEGITLPREWPRYAGIDYGYRAPFAVVWAAVDNDGRLWVYREICVEQVDPENQAKLILEAEAEAGERDVFRYADPSMWGHLGTPLTIADQYGMAGCGIQKADNDRINGWARVHSFLNDGPACQLHRAQGWEFCPMLHVLDGYCPRFCETIANLPRSKTRPEDADTKADDHCLIAGTMIATGRGDVPIENVVVGDTVATRSGMRSVTAAGRTGRDVPVTTLVLSNGEELTGTPSHPIWTDNRGWVSLDALRYSDILASCRTLRKSDSTESFIADTPTPRGTRSEPTSSQESLTAKRVWGAFTKRFGSRFTGQSPPATTFTTSTKTPSTTIQTILPASLGENTFLATKSKASCPRDLPGLTQRLWRKLPNGTGVTPGESGTRDTGPGLGSTENTSPAFASTAEQPTRLAQPMAWIASARTSARAAPEGQAEWTTKVGPAKSAPVNSLPTNTAQSERAPLNVVGNFGAGRADVYNLSVEGEPEFFANGVLVHNCPDAFRYLCGAVGTYAAPIIYNNTPSAQEIQKHIETLEGAYGNPQPLAAGRFAGDLGMHGAF
jgi:hypothetical protein